MISVLADVFTLKEPFRISRGARTKARVLGLRINRDGVEGRGEAVPYSRYGETLDGSIAQIRALPDDITRSALQDVMPPGAARNAVDCALWDLEAKSQGKPVWQLAGLSPPRPQLTAFSLSLHPPEQMEKAARRNAHRPVLKIKLGAADEDMARLEAVRRGAPKPAIIVDANEGWSAQIYREFAPYLRRLGVGLVEQPLPAGDDDMLGDIERLVPVCADEAAHDRASLPGLAGKYDVVNIKLDKTGGLTEALAMRRAVLQAGFGVMVGCMVGSSLAMAPAVLLAQGADYCDLDGPLLLAEDHPIPLVYDEDGVHPADARLWG